MSNEGEYLELVNDLRDQYNEMKEKFHLELSLKQERIDKLEDLIINLHHGYLNRYLKYNAYQFISKRPMGSQGRYTSSNSVHLDRLAW